MGFKYVLPSKMTRMVRRDTVDSKGTTTLHLSKHPDQTSVGDDFVDWVKQNSGLTHTLVSGGAHSSRRDSGAAFRSTVSALLPTINVNGVPMDEPDYKTSATYNPMVDLKEETEYCSSFGVPLSRSDPTAVTFATIPGPFDMPAFVPEDDIDVVESEDLPPSALDERATSGESAAGVDADKLTMRRFAERCTESDPELTATQADYQTIVAPGTATATGVPVQYPLGQTQSNGSSDVNPAESAQSARTRVPRQRDDVSNSMRLSHASWVPSDISRPSGKRFGFGKLKRAFTSMFSKSQAKSYIDHTPLALRGETSKWWHKSRRKDLGSAAPSMTYARDEEGFLMLDERGIPIPTLAKDGDEPTVGGTVSHSDDTCPVSLLSSDDSSLTRRMSRGRYSEVRGLGSLAEASSSRLPLPATPFPDRNGDTEEAAAPGTLLGAIRVGGWDPLADLNSNRGSGFSLESTGSQAPTCIQGRTSSCTGRPCNTSEQTKNSVAQTNTTWKTKWKPWKPWKRRLDEFHRGELFMVSEQASDLDEVLRALVEEPHLHAAFKNLESTEFMPEQFTSGLFNRRRPRRNRRDLETVGDWLQEQKTELDKYQSPHMQPGASTNTGLPSIPFDDSMFNSRIGSRVAKPVYR